PAAPAPATPVAPACGSRAVRRGAAAPRRSDARSADAAPRCVAVRDPGRHRERSAGSHSPAPNGSLPAAHRIGGPTPLASRRSPPLRGEPVRSPFFCVDLLQHLDVQRLLGYHLLQPRVLVLELHQLSRLAGL